MQVKVYSVSHNSMQFFPITSFFCVVMLAVTCVWQKIPTTMCLQLRQKTQYELPSFPRPGAKNLSKRAIRSFTALLISILDCNNWMHSNQWCSEGQAWPGTCPAKAPRSSRTCHATSHKAHTSGLASSRCLANTNDLATPLAQRGNWFLTLHGSPQ